MFNSVSQAASDTSRGVTSAAHSAGVSNVVQLFPDQWAPTPAPATRWERFAREPWWRLAEALPARVGDRMAPLPDSPRLAVAQGIAGAAGGLHRLASRVSGGQLSADPTAVAWIWENGRDYGRSEAAGDWPAS